MRQIEMLANGEKRGLRLCVQSGSRRMAAVLLAVAAWLLTFCFLSQDAFAAWRLDQQGYYWENSDGSYPMACWAWLDGNEDGIAECYYFKEDGYLLTDGVTPDGFTVDASGAWVQDGVVQTRETGLTKEADGQSKSIALGALTFETFAGLDRVEPQSDGSYLLSNKKGSSLARLQLVSLDSDAEMKEALDGGQKLGVAFDSAEMSRILTNAFVTSFAESFGQPDSVTEETYPTGVWHRLHYERLSSGGHEAQTDILLQYRERSAYCVIMVSSEGTNHVTELMQDHVH